MLKSSLICQQKKHKNLTILTIKTILNTWSVGFGFGYLVHVSLNIFISLPWSLDILRHDWRWTWEPTQLHHPRRIPHQHLVTLIIHVGFHTITFVSLTVSSHSELLRHWNCCNAAHSIVRLCSAFENLLPPSTGIITSFRVPLLPVSCFIKSIAGVIADSAEMLPKQSRIRFLIASVSSLQLNLENGLWVSISILFGLYLERNERFVFFLSPSRHVLRWCACSWSEFTWLLLTSPRIVRETLFSDSDVCFTSVSSIDCWYIIADFAEMLARVISD